MHGAHSGGCHDPGQANEPRHVRDTRPRPADRLFHPGRRLALAERENGRAYLATKVGDLAVQLEKGDHARCAKIAFQVAPGTDFDDIRRGIEAEGVRCQARNDADPRRAARW